MTETAIIKHFQYCPSWLKKQLWNISSISRSPRGRSDVLFTPSLAPTQVASFRSGSLQTAYHNIGKHCPKRYLPPLANWSDMSFRLGMGCWTLGAVCWHWLCVCISHIQTRNYFPLGGERRLSCFHRGKPTVAESRYAACWVPTNQWVNVTALLWDINVRKRGTWQETSSSLSGISTNGLDTESIFLSPETGWEKRDSNQQCFYWRADVSINRLAALLLLQSITKVE